jgi:hypothetical protein
MLAAILALTFLVFVVNAAVGVALGVEIGRLRARVDALAAAATPDAERPPRYLDGSTEG